MSSTEQLVEGRGFFWLVAIQDAVSHLGDRDEVYEVAVFGGGEVGFHRVSPGCDERARLAAGDYLAPFPPHRRRAILRGALVSVYGNEIEKGARPMSDGAVWLAEGKDGYSAELWGAGGVGNWAIRALREIGVVDEVMETENGLVVYPNAEAAGGKASDLLGDIGED